MRKAYEPGSKPASLIISHLSIMVSKSAEDTLNEWTFFFPVSLTALSIAILTYLTILS